MMVFKTNIQKDKANTGLILDAALLSSVSNLALQLGCLNFAILNTTTPLRSLKENLQLH